MHCVDQFRTLQVQEGLLNDQVYWLVSRIRLLYPWTPRLLKSPSTSSSHHFLGLSRFLLSLGFPSNSSLEYLSTGILHVLNLPLLTHSVSYGHYGSWTISGSLYKLWSSLFILILESLDAHYSVCYPLISHT